MYIEICKFELVQSRTIGILSAQLQPVSAVYISAWDPGNLHIGNDDVGV